MRLRHLLVFILIAVSISCAVTAPELPELGIEFIALVAILSIAVVSLSIMVGEALQSPGISAWSKDQLREVIAGVILAVLIWGATAGTTTIISALFLQDGVPDLPTMGKEALNPHIEYMESLYLKVADAYQTVGLYQGLSYFASLGGFWIYGGQGNSPYFGASVLMGPLGGAGNNLTIQILSFRLIQLFSEYVSAVFPTFILPIALAFRIFPFTRRMGNTLIAISLGALFVFPLSLMFVNEFWHATDWQYKDEVMAQGFAFDEMGLDQGFMDGVMNTIETICGSVAMRTFLSLGEIVWSLVFALIAAISCLTGYAACFVMYFHLFFWELWPLIATFLQLTIASIILTTVNMDWATGAAPGLQAIPETLLPAVMEATGFSIISLLVIAMITVTGTKAISTALGGEHVLYGISRFV